MKNKANVENPEVKKLLEERICEKRIIDEIKDEKIRD
jgi:hypothetical protein